MQIYGIIYYIKEKNKKYVILIIALLNNKYNIGGNYS